jgi:hypothetical protein
VPLAKHIEQFVRAAGWAEARQAPDRSYAASARNTMLQQFGLFRRSVHDFLAMLRTVLPVARSPRIK